MSFGIYWEPAKPTVGIELPTALKYVIAQRYFGGDGSTRGNDVFLGPSDTGYLQGVADATINEEVRDGAMALVAAIRRHNAIRVWIGDSDD